MRHHRHRSLPASGGVLGGSVGWVADWSGQWVEPVASPGPRRPAAPEVTHMPPPSRPTRQPAPPSMWPQRLDALFTDARSPAGSCRSRPAPAGLPSWWPWLWTTRAGWRTSGLGTSCPPTRSSGRPRGGCCIDVHPMPGHRIPGDGEPHRPPSELLGQHLLQVPVDRSHSIGIDQHRQPQAPVMITRQLIIQPQHLRTAPQAGSGMRQPRQRFCSSGPTTST